MGYDEFSTKLENVLIEFKRQKGRTLETVTELQEFLSEKLVKRRSKGLKSLKGMIF